MSKFSTCASRLLFDDFHVLLTPLLLLLDFARFLDDKIDEFFPRHNPHKNAIPLLCTMKPHSRPVPDPKDKIPSDLAKQVAMGSMTPYQALLALHEEEEDDEETVQCSEFDDDETSYYSSSSSSSSSDDESDSDYDSEEEEELYQIVGQLRRADLGTISED